MGENEVLILIKCFRIMANWTIEEKRQIWNKGQVVPGEDPAVWRKGQCGASSMGIDLNVITMAGK